MDRILTIIVGVDFTGASEPALAEAVRIAGWNGARVLAVHAADCLMGVTLQEGLVPCDHGARDGVRDEAERAWAALRPGHAAAEFEVHVGAPAAVLAQHARERRADLLVLGSESPDGPGACATQLLRNPPTKVLLVRCEHRGPFRTVVACIDFTEWSRRALRQAVRIANQDRAGLRVVCCERHREHAREHAAGTAADDGDPLLRELQAFCTASEPDLARLEPEFRTVGGTDPRKSFAAFAQSSGADLVVLGATERPTLKDRLVGCAAERIIQQTPCSLLAVPPDDG